MNNKLIKIIIPIILISIIIFISYKTYLETIKTSSNILTFIPTNASTIIQINNLENVRNIQNTIIWQKIREIDNNNLINNELHTIYNLIDSSHALSSNKLFLSIHKTGVSHTSILYGTYIERTDSEKSNDITEILKNCNNIKERIYDNKKIYINTEEKFNLHYYIHENVIFFSKSMLLIEDIIKKQNTNDNLLNQKNFNKAYQTVSSTADINLMVNFNKLFETLDIYSYINKNINHLAKWTCSDIQIKDNMLIANGFTSTEYQVDDYIDVLYNQEPQRTQITNIIPENTSTFFSIGFNNYKSLLERKNKLLQKNNNFWNWDKRIKAIYDSTGVNYYDFINQTQSEAGFFNTSHFNTNDNKYNYFKSENAIITSSFLQKLIKKIARYNDYQIYFCKDPNITSNLFGYLITTNTPYFTIIDDYFIFGRNQNSIKYLIDNYKVKNTLANSNHFNNFKTLLSSKSNLTYYTNPGKTFKKIQKNLDKKYHKSININEDSLLKFTGFALQISNKGSLFSNNITLFYDENFEQKIQEKWILRIDTILFMKPQFVTNHFTNDKMIIIQDKSNILYAINSDGVIKWKKQLEEKIIGEVNTIDIYKNNKYQCVFNTQSKLYVIDRNGEYVDGFPKKLPVKTKIGHALFDYNNKKKYRIIIVGEDNMIYNLNKNGNKVTGWKYKKQKNRITNTPKHFKYKTKDYILEETRKKTTRLLAINGSERVLLTSESILNSSPIISEKGILYSITIDGRLWKGTLDGNTTETILPNLNPESKFTLNDNKFIFTERNKVHAIDEEFNTIYSLDFNEEVKHISNYKKLLIVETISKLYLYKNGEIIDGFPINNNGAYNISDINNNNKINIINVINNSIYNYELFD